ncbi:hypothetical protein QL285_019418 [Trifolium repens]|nr:hypothetical protein QL285_019418 [Trifolium repens]
MRKEHGGMGFRHLYGFNLAMLGKQGWRLTTNHDTIVARIFKSRYYPRGSFLEANLGHNPNFIWRSIHTSQVIVKGGLRWRIGDGTNIRVWQDAWLRDEDNSFITTPMIEGRENMRVCDLMEAGGGGWRRNLIYEYFNTRDAHCISNIPLFGDMQEDTPCWKFLRNGEYSVKSAYYYTMENLVDNNELRVEGNWQNIWELKIPQKMKVFLWRAARGCLPTRQRLQQKGVNCPHTCAHCQQNFENEWHLFFGCEKAQEIWEEAGLWYLIEGMFETADGFVSLFFKLLDLLSQHLVFQFVSALWCIWKRRNQNIWEDIELQPSVSFQLARDVILQWQTAQTKKQEQNSAATIASHVVTTAARRILDDDSPATTTTTAHVVWRSHLPDKACTNAMLTRRYSRNKIVMVRVCV